ncbi:MAG TPA: hypothetical protein VOA78_14880 [Candidatus Dormibacteraeota bacterium]|nr:hypothetical protein [Candidatus Dormibacteraeota bacterium]
MTHRRTTDRRIPRPTRSFANYFALAAAAALLLLPLAGFAQTSSTGSADRWLHVRVISSDNRGETVRVNIPLDMAEKVLPAINKDRLHSGKVRISEADCNGLDIKAILEAVRTSKDGEFVTVQGDENDVRVAKQGGYLLIHVTDKSGKHHLGRHMNHSDSSASSDKSDKTDKTAKVQAVSARESKVEIKVPMKVIDALFSAGKDELDLVAALHALSTYGDTELVSVKDDENTVRVWLDSKNVAD